MKDTWFLFDDTCEDLGIEGAVGRVGVLPLLGRVNRDASVGRNGNTVKKLRMFYSLPLFTILYKTAQHNAVSPGLTPAPEDAAAADGASESAGCLHFHLWLDQWDTVLSWSQASCTCPDACWDSARAVGGVALGSFDTCFLVSWS